jgi:hypothetical protein
MPPLLQVLASVLVPPLALLILVVALRGERRGMVHNAMASETDPPKASK